MDEMEKNDTSVKRFICSFEQCSKTFSKAVRLKHHLMTHSGERPHICDVASCHKSYTRAAHLKRHIQVSHREKPAETPSIQCTYEGCNSTLASESSMNKHLKNIHQGSYLYKCTEPDCGQAFRKRHQLKAHQYHHKGVLPFQCEYSNCQKRFSQKSHLDRHRKQHEGYRCSSGRCEEIFPVFSLLVKHQALCHTQSKDHLCPDCGKTFHSKSWLTQHQKTHSDNRTLYKCPEDGCPRAYLDMRNLTAHHRSYHDSKKFVCDQETCARAFVTKQKLQQHQKLHAASTSARPKKYPNKGHQKKDVVTCLTGVSKKALVSMAIDIPPPTDDMEVSSDADCEDVDLLNEESVPDGDAGPAACTGGDPCLLKKDVTPGAQHNHPILDIQCQRLEQMCGPPSTSCHNDDGIAEHLLHSRT